MKLRTCLYLCLAVWLVFPCIAVVVWVTDCDLLLGNTGTAFLLQTVLNDAAAVCGAALAFLHYQKSEKGPKNKAALAGAAAGIALLLVCWNGLCTFFDGMQEYHSFTSPNGAHTVVLMENVDPISGQVVLYERITPFLIAPRGRVITNNGYRPVCAGEYALVWDGDTVTLSVSDGAGETKTVSAELKEH